MPEWVLRYGDTDLTKQITLPAGQVPRGLALHGEWRVDQTPDQVEAAQTAADAASQPASTDVPAPVPVAEPTPEQAPDPLNLDKE